MIRLGRRFFLAQEKTKRAFTLIELLISIAIVAFISTMALANFRDFSRKNELRLTAEEVVAEMFRLKTMTQSGKSVIVCGEESSICSENCPPDCQAKIPLGGYGARFENSEILFFADLDNSKSYSGNEEIGSFDLNPNIEIENLENPLDIIFQPPRGDFVVVKNGNVSGDNLEIILKHKISKEERKIIFQPTTQRIEIQ